MERLFPWLRRSGWAYALAAIALVLLAWRIANGGAETTQPVTTAPVSIETGQRSERGLLVHVAGAVRRPGVYRVPAGARVNLAVRLAGGAKPDADLSAINLAAALEDGQQVLVSARTAPGAAAPTPSSSGGGSPAGPIRLSNATAEQLDGLDGIGPTLAARIVAWRTEHGGFSTVDQLLEVPGIGQARLEALRKKVIP